MLVNHKGGNIMNENNISIKQKLVSQENDENIIEIIVENNCTESIDNVSVVSQNICHEFGLIDPQTLKTVSYSVNVPNVDDLKKDFGEDAELPDKLEIPPVTLKYSIEDESFELKSNSLVLIL